MLLIPRATEKSYAEQTKRTYVFIVEAGASKQAIAKAVADEYKVTVENVRTLVRKGKATRFSRGKHAYPGITHRQDKHLAYVTVKEGDKIPVFEEDTQPEDKAASKSAKADNADNKTSQAKSDKKSEKSEKGDKK